MNFASPLFSLKLKQMQVEALESCHLSGKHNLKESYKHAFFIPNFLTFTNFEKLLRTDITDMKMGQKLYFRENVKGPCKESNTISCIYLQSSNPYWFRKTLWTDNSYSVTDFRKIVEKSVRGSYNNHLYKILVF